MFRCSVQNNVINRINGAHTHTQTVCTVVYMRKRGANSAFQGGETKQDDDNEEDFDEYLAETILK